MHTTVQDTVEQAVWSQAHKVESPENKPRRKAVTPFAPKAARSLLSLVNMEIASRRVSAQRKSGRRRSEASASRWSMPQWSRLVLPRPPSHWTLPESWRARPRASLAGVVLAGLLGALAASYFIAPDRLDLALAYMLEPVGEFTGESDEVAVAAVLAPEAQAPAAPAATDPALVAAEPAPVAHTPVATTPAAIVPAPPAPTRATLAPPPPSRSVAAPRAPAPAPAAAARPAPADDFADIFRDPPPRMSELTAEAVVNGVKANAASGVHCLRQAVARGEIENGSHKLVLDWTIRPDGRVSVAQVVGPANMLRTSIPSCYGRAMHAWQFPASRRGAPVRNFPLSFTVR